MFILRKLLKLLLLLVAFVLFFTRWALETSVKLTEWAVGLLTLIVGAAIIYSIVIHSLPDGRCVRWACPYTAVSLRDGRCAPSGVP